MSRRKAFATRHDLPPAEIASPNEIRRLRDSALSGLRDASFGSEIGRLSLVGKLSSGEVSTAKRWAELVRAYSVAMRSPRAPATVEVDACGGMPADVSSEAGVKEARRHARTTAEWIEGRDALRKSGRDVEAIVEAVVIADRSATGYAELIALKAGLAALSATWAAKRKR